MPSTQDDGSLCDLYIEPNLLLEHSTVEELDSLLSAGGSTVGSVSSISTASCPGGCIYSYTTVSSKS